MRLGVSVKGLREGHNAVTRTKLIQNVEKRVVGARKRKSIESPATRASDPLLRSPKGTEYCKEGVQILSKDHQKDGISHEAS